MIVATAGHVDHGKTSLIKHLTGVDTDKLEEEKRRGLTIDLGFAYRQVSEQTTLGFIDVPGHSRFINTMIAGVSGIDLGMLVIAADDGLMPQTREHLDVMRLLGVPDVIVVVSKTDRVEPQCVDELVAQVRALVPSCLGVFPVSNLSEQGLGELAAWLDARALAFCQRNSRGNFRLPIDRVFTLKGVGLVVTGTAISGQLAAGDELQVLPGGDIVRVRSLRVQDGEAEQGRAGDRCALNIAGAQQAISKGHTLATIDSLHCAKHLDARLALLPNAPFALKHLTPIKLYIGSKRLPARLYLIDKPQSGRLQPGGEALVQLILEQDIACCKGDRFLIRDDSESITLGGGEILDPAAPKVGKSRQHRLDYLAAMCNASPVEIFKALLAPGSPPVNVSKLGKSLNLPVEELAACLGELAATRFESGETGYAVSDSAWENAGRTLLSLIGKWHAQNPERKGMAVLELQKLFISLQPEEATTELFSAVVTRLLRDAKLNLAGGLITSASHRMVLSPIEQSHWEKLHQRLRHSAMKIPTVTELAQQAGLLQAQAGAALESAARIKLVHKINDGRFALAEHLLAHALIVAQLAEYEEGLTVISYKNKIGSGRKLAIDILEYFDSLRYTQRRGNSRVILDASLAEKLFAR